MGSWVNIAAIYACLTVSYSAGAQMDYDVNFISINSKESILIITINGCDTKFVS